jgi:hypothetical protein
MPRPKNANMLATLWSQDENHDAPGETWDGLPTKVEPPNPETGHKPNERPAAEIVNWRENRIEKLLWYLDTIDVRNFMPHASAADVHANGIDFDGARYVIAGEEGDGSGGAAFSSGNGNDFTQTNESAQLVGTAEYGEEVFDVCASGRRTYLFTDGALWVRTNFNAYTVDQISETVGADFYTHRGLIGQAWKDPEISDLVWNAWLSQKSPAGASDWITIGRATPTGHVWTTGGAGGGNGRTGMNTGHLQDPNDPRVDRAMFSWLDGMRVCIVNGPSIAGNVLLQSVDVAGDYLAWSNAGALSGITGTIVGLARSGDWLVAVTALGRCYRSSDAVTWDLVSFPLGVLSARMTFLEVFSPAMIAHGSALVAVGELSAASFGAGGEAIVLVGSFDHGETWEVLAGWPTDGGDFYRMRSMQDGRIACLTWDGTSSQIAYSLRTRSVPTGSDDT